MELLVTMVGLLLVLEGLPYVACPEAMQDWLRQLITMPPKVLRGIGLAAMCVGLFLCYLTQRTNLFL